MVEMTARVPSSFVLPGKIRSGGYPIYSTVVLCLVLLWKK